MKKRLLAAFAATAITLSISADNEWLYVYRNDNAFHALPLATLKDIRYVGNEKDGFTTLFLSDDTGEEPTAIPLASVDSCAIGAQVPIIRITLPDNPSMTELVNKEEYLRATVRVEGNGYCDDIASWDTKIKGRGNSTWYFPKKPYRFKGDKKVSLCGMKKAKSFALIANYLDPSLMRNAVAMWVARRLGMPYTNHSIPVMVYLNDIYKGAYMATEKIGIGSGSVDIDETKGILFEMDINYDEDYKFRYTWDNGAKDLPVMVKDPDLAEIAALDATGATTAQGLLASWQADFTAMADAVLTTPTTGDISRYVDLESLVNYMIVNTVAGNNELDHPKSVYIYKESLGDDATYHFGPVWDFDWAYNYSGVAQEASPRNVTLISDGESNGCTFFKALCRNEAFMTLYRERWQRFMAEDYADLLSYMDSYAALVEPSAKQNGLAWPTDYSASWAQALTSYDYRTEYGKLRTWIIEHVAWCDAHPHLGLYR
jgi:hypothetical protein